MNDINQKKLGSTLWNIADQLRGAMNADDFRDYMLSFLFLRYLSDNYETAAKKELGYTVAHGPQLAPGEPAAERDSFSEVVLVGRLREAVRRLNPAIPEEAREDALRKLLRVGSPSHMNTRNHA